MVNNFSFTKVTSPEGELRVYSVSEHIVSHLESPTVLESKVFLDNMEKMENLQTLKTILSLI